MFPVGKAKTSLKTQNHAENPETLKIRPQKVLAGAVKEPVTVSAADPKAAAIAPFPSPASRPA